MIYWEIIEIVYWAVAVVNLIFLTLGLPTQLPSLSASRSSIAFGIIFVSLGWPIAYIIVWRQMTQDNNEEL